MTTTKRGRPTTETKDYMLRVRLGQTTKAKLERLEKDLQLSKSEIVREGIDLLEKQK